MEGIFDDTEVIQGCIKFPIPPSRGRDIKFMGKSIKWGRKSSRNELGREGFGGV